MTTMRYVLFSAQLRFPSDTHRLYSKGRILGHKRGKRNSRPNQSLIAIEGVDSKESAESYLGKVGLAAFHSHWLAAYYLCAAMMITPGKG